MEETRSTSHNKLIPMKYSWEEINTRREAGLCIFCDEQETHDHHLKHKRLRLVMVDLAYTSLVDVEDLKRDSDLKAEEDKKVAEIDIKTEVETKLIANLVQEAFLEDESTPQVQVPIANSEILKSIEPREVNLGLENLKSVVMNENLEQDGVQMNVTKRFEVDGNVQKTQKVLSVTEICCAHQVFGKMSPHEEKLGIKKIAKGFKSWMFKFKHIKEKIKKRDYKGWFHTWGRKMSWKKNKFSKTWSMLNVDCFKDDDQVYHESLPIGLLSRFTFWKFKFIKRNLQKTRPQIEEVMMGEDHKQQQGDNEPLATAPDYDIKFMKMNLQKKMGGHGYVNHEKLMSDKERHDDILIRYNLQWKIHKLKCYSKSSQFEFPNKNVSGYNLDRDFVLEMDHWYPYVNLETGSFLETDSMSELELESTKSEHYEMFIVTRAVSMESMRGLTFGITDSDAGQGEQSVYDRIVMVKEQLLQTSLVLQEVMRNTKIKFSKRWWFKYKFGEEGLTRLSSSNWCMTYSFAVWHCWNSKIMVYVAMSGDHWFWIVSVRKSTTSSFLLLLYDHRMGVPSILRFCLLKELNQDRHELCSENKGCLDCFQALVLMKGITNSSSSEEEWMKEEADSVKVNKVKLEIQTCHLKSALFEAKMMVTKTKSLCNEESVYILEDLSAAILEKNQPQIYCGIDCDDFQCDVIRFWEFTAFDKIPLGRTVLTKGRKKMFYKSRRSKFKHRVASRGLQSGFEIWFWRLVIYKLGGKAKPFAEMCQCVDQLVKMESAKVERMLDVTQSQTFDPGIRLESQETLRSLSKKSCFNGFHQMDS